MILVASQGHSAMLDSTLLYRLKEYSFDVIPQHFSGFTSVLLNDLNLEVDETGKLISFWGMCPYTKWIKSNLSPPDTIDGELSIIPNTPFIRGVSQEIIPRRFPVLADRSIGWIQIRGDHQSVSSIRVMPGVIFEIGALGEFCSLWLGPKQWIS